jgi:hypothetical protein
VIQRSCELHARNRGFTEAFMSTYPDAVDLAGARSHALTSVAELARRAQTTGRLRPDFVLDDVVIVLQANHGIHAPTTAARVTASRRFAALATQALGTGPDRSPLPPAARHAATTPAPLL